MEWADGVPKVRRSFLVSVAVGLGVLAATVYGGLRAVR